MISSYTFTQVEDNVWDGSYSFYTNGIGNGLLPGKPEMAVSGSILVPVNPVIAFSLVFTVYALQREICLPHVHHNSST